MQIRAPRQNHYLRTATVFVLCLSSVFLLPFIALLTGNGFFFFSTQVLFPYDAFYTRGDYGYVRGLLFSRSVATWLNVVHWALAGMLFVWLARRWSIGWAILAAIAMILVVGFVTPLVFEIFGVYLELDGL